MRGLDCETTSLCDRVRADWVRRRWSKEEVGSRLDTVREAADHFGEDVQEDVTSEATIRSVVIRIGFFCRLQYAIECQYRLFPRNFDMCQK